MPQEHFLMGILVSPPSGEGALDAFTHTGVIETRNLATEQAVYEAVWDLTLKAYARERHISATKALATRVAVTAFTHTVNRS